MIHHVIDRRLAAALATVAALAAVPADAGSLGIVVAAPGRPGSTEQAAATLDAFAGLIAPGVRAGYTNDLDTGLAWLRDPSNAAAMVPLAFYLRYGDELGLRPVARVIERGGAEQPWTLVAGKGTVDGPAAMSGRTIAGLPGYAPDVVRHVLLADWGPLPDDVTIRPSRRVLGDLRAATRDGSVAVLLDATQAEGLASLPFGDALEVLHTTAALPTSLVCSIGDRLDAAGVDGLRTALTRLHERDEAREVLAEMRIERFVALDAGVERVLQSARGALAAKP